jgi:diguanylate cyclase (GGDEF)-like protein
MANQIRLEVESLNIAHTGNQNSDVLTISMGLLTILNKTTDKASLYEEADKLLYDAKRSGRNRVSQKVV